MKGRFFRRDAIAAIALVALGAAAVLAFLAIDAAAIVLAAVAAVLIVSYFAIWLYARRHGSGPASQWGPSEYNSDDKSRQTNMPM